LEELSVVIAESVWRGTVSQQNHTGSSFGVFAQGPFLEGILTWN